MARILVKAISHTHPDPEKDQRGAYKRGMPVVVFEDGHVWGNAEVPPAFFHLDIPGTPKATVENWIRGWDRTISFNVINSDVLTDTHTVEVSAGNVSSSLGHLAQAQVENFLTRWNATLDSATLNLVTFTAGIYDAITSEGFWERDVSGVIFAEVSYEPASGVHRVSANYAALGVPAGTGSAMVTRRGGSVVSDVARVVIFDIARSVVRQAFFDDVDSKLDKTIARRRFQLTPTEMAAIEAEGGTATRTLAQVQAALTDRTTE